MSSKEADIKYMIMLGTPLVVQWLGFRFCCRGCTLIPGRGAKILHASWPIKQNRKHKKYCNKFTKGFKSGLHQKTL